MQVVQLFDDCNNYFGTNNYGAAVTSAGVYPYTCIYIYIYIHMYKMKSFTI